MVNISSNLVRSISQIIFYLTEENVFWYAYKCLEMYRNIKPGISVSKSTATDLKVIHNDRLKFLYSTYSLFNWFRGNSERFNSGLFSNKRNYI